LEIEARLKIELVNCQRNFTNIIKERNMADHLHSRAVQ